MNNKVNARMQEHYAQCEQSIKSKRDKFGNEPFFEDGKTYGEVYDYILDLYKQ